MTSRRTRIATAATAAALGVAGLGLMASPATAATPSSSSGTTVVGTTVTPSAAAKACDRAPWEAKVQGAPKNFGSGSASGDYLWHDSNGFHLRVTHGRNHDERVYSGEVVANEPMRIDPVKLEKGDTLKLAANRKSFVFVFANHGYIDGVNFHTDCGTTLELKNLHIGNDNQSTKQVYLGYWKQHPEQIPFWVHRYHATAKNA